MLQPWQALARYPSMLTLCRPADELGAPKACEEMPRRGLARRSQRLGFDRVGTPAISGPPAGKSALASSMTRCGSARSAEFRAAKLPPVVRQPAPISRPAAIEWQRLLVGAHEPVEPQKRRDIAIFV